MRVVVERIQFIGSHRTYTRVE